MSPINYVCKSRHFVLLLVSGFTPLGLYKAGCSIATSGQRDANRHPPIASGLAARNLSELILFWRGLCVLNYFLPV